MQALALLGRVLMSVIFLRGGYGKLMAPTATMGMFTHYHLPVVGAVYAVAVVVELVGGALILIGWKTRFVAPVMAVWCIATALVAHWHPDDNMQMINFMKNLCMAGGFLQLAVYGAGPFSVDRR
ncbi:MAG TPA: DoxX family protein [Acetobacteraceae bacterium]|jgi:putative oxidoreductase|nr:DoxX family protein [Acetobacteraceae bacterium]